MGASSSPSPGDSTARAIAHYTDVVRTCRQLGMEPVVTLQHFTLPVWLAQAGGFTAPEAPVRFARYVAACVEAFGDMVTWWVTVNEPAVAAVLGHLGGTVAARRALAAPRDPCDARSAAHARRWSAGDPDRLRPARHARRRYR